MAIGNALALYASDNKTYWPVLPGANAAPSPSSIVRFPPRYQSGRPFVFGVAHGEPHIRVHDIDAGDPAWDRLWAAAEHTGMPISFHILTHSKTGGWDNRGPYINGFQAIIRRQ